MIPKPSELESWNLERMFTPHPVSCVKCHVSRVMCHVSRVTCHVSRVNCHMSFFFFFIVKKIWQSGGASRWRVCYQRGLPRLVSLWNHPFYCAVSRPDLKTVKWNATEDDCYTEVKSMLRSEVFSAAARSGQNATDRTERGSEHPSTENQIV